MIRPVSWFAPIHRLLCEGAGTHSPFYSVRIVGVRDDDRLWGGWCRRPPGATLVLSQPSCRNRLRSQSTCRRTIAPLGPSSSLFFFAMQFNSYVRLCLLSLAPCSATIVVVFFSCRFTWIFAPKIDQRPAVSTKTTEGPLSPRHRSSSSRVGPDGTRTEDGATSGSTPDTRSSSLPLHHHLIFPHTSSNNPPQLPFPRCVYSLAP